MAYNSNKGSQQSGDIQFENDPTDTQIDFDNDFVAIKTNAKQRLIISGSFITSSVPFSCSSGITGASLNVDGIVDAKQGLSLNSVSVINQLRAIQNATSISGSSLISGAGLRIDTNGVIGTAGDNDLMTLANNQLSVAGAISGSGFFSSIAGVRIDTGKVIGTTGDPNLLSLNNNELVVAGALTASTDLSGRSLTLDVGKTIGITGDTDLMTLTANTVTVAGALTASTDLAGRSLTLDVGKTIGIAGDTDLVTLTANTVTVAGVLTASAGITGSAIRSDGDIKVGGTISGSGFFSNIAGIRIDTGKVIGTAGDPDLLSLNNNQLVVAGALTASAGITGSEIKTAGGVLRVYNKTGNPTIESTLNHLTLRNTRQNKNIIIQLGDNNGNTELQIKNNAGNEVAEIDSQGAMSMTSVSASSHVSASAATIIGDTYLSGSHRSAYVYRVDPLTAPPTTYDVLASDNVVIFNATGSHFARLPAISSLNDGVQYYIKNIGAGTVTLTGSLLLDQFIDGQETLVCSQGDSIKVIGHKVGAFGFGWAVLSFHNV